ncbi:MAG: hypothetical protein L0271_07210 [Gemmatimonadetes bacterium]|nr:hypothetical protein [Gemmatimonadota bacterium]
MLRAHDQGHERTNGVASTPTTVSAERWRRIERLFHAAAALPVDRREAYLRAATPADPELCAEVQSLLRADGTAEARIDAVIRRTLLAFITHPDAC